MAQGRFFDGEKLDTEDNHWSDDFFIETDDRFNVSQVYEDQPARRVKCIKCNGIHFEVASGDHFTAIKCITCKWEAPIHEG